VPGATLIADPPRQRDDARTLSSPSAATRSSAPPISNFVAALAFFPIANWIPGGDEVESYRAVANECLNGTVILLGVPIVLTILAHGGGNVCARDLASSTFC
jgi:hypothetical protein